jgi:hypothetical protein
MQIPSSSTSEDKLTKFTYVTSTSMQSETSEVDGDFSFVFELQRRPNPLTPEHYFEVQSRSYPQLIAPLIFALRCTAQKSCTHPK